MQIRGRGDARGGSTGRGDAAGRGGYCTGRGDAAGRGASRRGGSAAAGHGASSSGAHAGTGSSSGVNNASGPLIPVGDPVGEMMARLGGLGPKGLSMNGVAIDDTQYEMDSDDDEQGMLDGIQEFERRMAGGASRKPPPSQPAVCSSKGVVSSVGKFSTPGTGKMPVPVQRKKAPQQQQQQLHQQQVQQQQQHSIQMRHALQVVKDAQPGTNPQPRLSKPEVDAVDNDADRDDVRAAMRDLDRFDYGGDSDDG